MSDVKQCCACMRVKPVEQFYRRATAIDGRQGRCKRCIANKTPRGDYRQLPKGTADQQIHVRVPYDVHRQIKGLAKARRESVTRFTVTLLVHALRTADWKPRHHY